MRECPGHRTLLVVGGGVVVIVVVGIDSIAMRPGIAPQNKIESTNLHICICMHINVYIILYTLAQYYLSVHKYVLHAHARTQTKVTFACVEKQSRTRSE